MSQREIFTNEVEIVDEVKMDKTYGLDISYVESLPLNSFKEEHSFYLNEPEGNWWLSQFYGVIGTAISDKEFKTKTSPYGECTLIINPTSAGLKDTGGNEYIGYEKISDENGIGWHIWLTEFAPEWLREQFKTFLHLI